MDLLQFADDSALTPVSEIKQAAKARARENGRKLANALDTEAHGLFYPRWDALIEDCWTLHPPHSDACPQSKDPVLAGTRDGRKVDIQIGHDLDAPLADADICLCVHDSLEDGRARRLLYVGGEADLGRSLDLAEDEKSRLSRAGTFQARLRAIAAIALAYADRVPRHIGPSLTDTERHEAAQAAAVPDPADSIQIVAEIPGTKDRYEATLNLGESRDSLFAWLRPDETPGLHAFRVQKDGRLIARRAKFKSEAAAREALAQAIEVLSFLEWTGLAYPNGRDHDRARSDQPRITEHRLLDHYHILVERKSGATVLLNQPYSGNRPILDEGLFNLLKPGTITAEAPAYCGLLGGSRTLFHALERQGADLEVIAAGAVIAQKMTRQASITRAAPTPRKARAARTPAGGAFLTPGVDALAPPQDIPREEMILLAHSAPSVKQLKTPYWRRKMKAFEGREQLSWELQDRHQGDGITLDDVLKALDACPLDADIWGFFDLFDFTEATKAELFRRGAIAGELYLGRRFFTAEKGNFWGMLDTRPYMRLVNMLYRSLVKMQRPAEALPLGLWMLELNTNDNIGIRFDIDEVAAAAKDPRRAGDLAESFANQDAEAAGF